MDFASLARLLLLAALWGASFLFMRIAAPVLGALPTAFGRETLGALGLFALIALLRTPLSFQGKFAATLVLGCINSGIPFLMYALAAKVLPVGYSAILNAMTPLMGVLIGAAASMLPAQSRRLSLSAADARRVGELVRQMTLDEKIGQMTQPDQKFL